MIFDLGGFAEDENAVDGDYKSFNYCLAENYYYAMIGEDWNLIGDSSTSLIDNIVFWLSYDEELRKESNYNLESIEDGSFLTVNGRTFIDAIVSEKRVELAETYIRLGVRDPRLFVIYMLYYKDIYDIDHPMNSRNYVYSGTILNIYRPDNRNELIEFLSNVFIELDRIYSEIIDKEEQLEFLNLVRLNIKGFKYSGNFEKIYLTDFCQKDLARKLINKKESNYE